MKLIDNFGTVLKKAWSVRLTLLASAFGGLEVALPLFSDVVPKGVFLVLSILTTVGACFARIVAQPSIHDDTDPSTDEPKQ